MGQDEWLMEIQNTAAVLIRIAQQCPRCGGQECIQCQPLVHLSGLLIIHRDMAREIIATEAEDEQRAQTCCGGEGQRHLQDERSDSLGIGHAPPPHRASPRTAAPPA
jgi:hypothetical protein